MPTEFMYRGWASGYGEEFGLDVKKVMGLWRNEESSSTERKFFNKLHKTKYHSTQFQVAQHLFKEIV